MPSGICTLSIIPCRKEPSSTSEMVTQLLFGETYQVLESADDWLKISTHPDKYECWINARQHSKISEQQLKTLKHSAECYAADLVQLVQNSVSDVRFPVTMGASLVFCQLKTEEFAFTSEGQTVTPGKTEVSSLLSTAFLYLHAPYLWGGKTPFGIDCSGFTQMVYRLNGYQLPRDASQQVEHGEPLSFVEEAQAGDLAFFDNEAGNIVHVGILLDNQQIIHASGKVRIDKFDHYGIFSPELRGYSHHLRVIKRLL